MSEDRQIAGTYLHGLFDQASATSALLQWAGLPDLEAQKTVLEYDYMQLREDGLNRLADALEQHLDWVRLSPYL